MVTTMISDSISGAVQILEISPKRRQETDRRPAPQDLPLQQSLATEPSDEILLTQVAGGSKEALGLLFRRHRNSVLRVGSRILTDTSEAEDLCQEVFLLLFQKANSFDPNRGSASSWIIQIAYSRALNRRQYLTNRQHYTAHEFDEERLEAEKKLALVDDVFARSLLSRLRDQLTDEQFHTLNLHFFEGYSLREIAEKTSQTIGNVRNHYYRGLERLRANVFPQKDI